MTASFGWIYWTVLLNMPNGFTFNLWIALWEETCSFFVPKMKCHILKKVNSLVLLKLKTGFMVGVSTSKIA